MKIMLSFSIIKCYLYLLKLREIRKNSDECDTAQGSLNILYFILQMYKFIIMKSQLYFLKKQGFFLVKWKLSLNLRLYSHKMVI